MRENTALTNRVSNFQHPTYQTLAELGQVVKTIFLCQYLHEDALCRDIHDGFQVIENWNSANAFTFNGKAAKWPRIGWRIRS